MSQSKTILTPNSLKINTIKIHAGCPHFKGEIRKYQQADYNIFKALYEFIDNVISKKQTQNIYLDFKFDGNQITNILIRDDYYPGFENIRVNGIGNPFNLSHMRLGQDDDTEISQFGVGMKAGAISLSNRMDIYTRVDGSYYHIELDFIEMSQRDDPMESYNPNIKIISVEDYEKYHSLSHGSSIYLTNIRNSMYSEYDKKSLLESLRLNITQTYTELLKIKPINLYINSIKIQPNPSYFDAPECSIYNRYVKIYKLKNGSLEVFYGYFSHLEKNNYKILNPKTGRLKSIDNSKIVDMYLKNNYRYEDSFSPEEKYCMLLESTFTMYHPDMQIKVKESGRDNMPRNRIMVYRDGRLYGKWFREKSNDGNHNFNDTRLFLSSKKILTEMGLTFNKHMSQHVKNNTYKSLWVFFKELRKGFNANTSTKDNKILYEKAIEHHINVGDGSQKEIEGKLVDFEERRPKDYRESKPKKKKKVKKSNREILTAQVTKGESSSGAESLKIVSSTQEDTIRILYTMIQDFKEHTLDDFNLMEAKKVAEEPCNRESMFKIQSILNKYNLKNRKHIVK